MMRVLLAVLALLAGTAWFVTAAEGAQRTAGSCDAGDFAIAGCSYDSSSAATTPPVNPHSDAARARPDSSSVPRASTSRITPSLAAKVGSAAPKVTRTTTGEITNGSYTVSRVPQARHTTGSTTSGRSQFLFRIDADQAVLDASAYADEAGLWVNNKAKVFVENGPVGVVGRTGEPTSYLNLYRTKGGYIHGSPGGPPR